jgi:formiminoglutamate deiminase
VTAYWAADVQLPAGLAHGVRFRVDDGIFSSIEIDTAPASGDERLSGVVLPGLANAHSHAFHRALRGRTHSGGGSFWTWRDQMYGVAGRLDPDSYRELARALYLEMALAGITVVGEFHYLHHGPGGVPYADPNAMGMSLIEAAQEVGIRITLLDACYLSGGLTGDGHQAVEGVQRRFSDRDPDAWAIRVDALRSAAQTAARTVKIGAAAHSVRSLPAASLARLAELAGDRPLHVHLSEQPAENAAAQAFYGCSPTELLDRSGLLGEHTTAVHATHLSGGDIALLGGGRVTCCFCPTTERDLADGIGPARRLSNAGSPLSLGSDSHAVVDAFEEIRGLEMHERLNSGERGRFRPDELIESASRSGYHCLGWKTGGEIAAGGLADFVVVRRDSVRTAGSAPDQIVFSATAADIDRVVVAGTPIVRDGAHRSGRVAPALIRAIDQVSEPQP